MCVCRCGMYVQHVFFNACMRECRGMQGVGEEMTQARQAGPLLPPVTHTNHCTHSLYEQRLKQRNSQSHCSDVTHTGSQMQFLYTVQSFREGGKTTGCVPGSFASPSCKVTLEEICACGSKKKDLTVIQLVIQSQSKVTSYSKYKHRKKCLKNVYDKKTEYYSCRSQYHLPNFSL